MSVAYVDESFGDDLVSIGIAVVDVSSIRYLHGLLLGEYKRLLSRFSLSYKLDEAKFSYVLSRLAKKISLDRRDIKTIVVDPILETLSSRCVFVSLVAKQAGALPEIFLNGNMFYSEWFLREYRRRFGKSASRPKDKVIKYAKILRFLLAPISSTVNKIVLDRNLGALGKNLSQLVIVLELLTRKKIETPQTYIDELGIQLADFIAGASKYLEANARIFLNKNTIVFKL